MTDDRLYRQPGTGRFIIPHKTGWSVGGVMLSGDKNTTVSLQADFPRAETYTVQFSMSPIDPILAAPNFAEAELLWSVEGNQIRRLVSVVNGASVSGLGQAVRMTVRDTSFDWGDGGLGRRYQVSATVSTGTRAAVQMPPRLQGTPGLQLVPPGGNFVLAIPQNAGVISMMVYARSVTAGLHAVLPGDITILQTSIAAGHDIANTDQASNDDWIPIFPGADTVVINNSTVAGPGGKNIYISLIWGIDG